MKRWMVRHLWSCVAVVVIGVACAAILLWTAPKQDVIYRLNSSGTVASLLPSWRFLGLSDSDPSLDSALKAMVAGHVVFNNPETMRVGDTAEVQAVLATVISVDDLMKLLTADGKKESEKLMVSDRMQATLTGGGAFDVSPSGPQSQWISKTGATTWHWLVTPKLTGEQFLTLTIDAIVMLDKEKDTRNISTLTRKIVVEVARPHNEEEWFEWIKKRAEAIGWGWGVIGAAFAAVVAATGKIRGWFKRKPAETKPADENDG
jgi:hypothetical protein